MGLGLGLGLGALTVVSDDHERGVMQPPRAS